MVLAEDHRGPRAGAPITWRTRKVVRITGSGVPAPPVGEAVAGRLRVGMARAEYPYLILVEKGERGSPVGHISGLCLPVSEVVPSGECLRVVRAQSSEQLREKLPQSCGSTSQI